MRGRLRRDLSRAANEPGGRTEWLLLSLVDRFLELLARGEAHRLHPRYPHSFAGVGIEASPRLAMRYGKSPKPDQSHFVVLAQAIGDRTLHRVDGPLSLGLCYRGAASNLLDQVALVHSPSEPEF